MSWSVHVTPFYLLSSNPLQSFCVMLKWSSPAAAIAAEHSAAFRQRPLVPENIRMSLCDVLSGVSKLPLNEQLPRWLYYFVHCAVQLQSLALTVIRTRR